MIRLFFRSAFGSGRKLHNSDSGRANAREHNVHNEEMINALQVVTARMSILKTGQCSVVFILYGYSQ